MKHLMHPASLRSAITHYILLSSQALRIDFPSFAHWTDASHLVPTGLASSPLNSSAHTLIGQVPTAEPVSYADCKSSGILQVYVLFSTGVSFLLPHSLQEPSYTLTCRHRQLSQDLLSYPSCSRIQLGSAMCLLNNNTSFVLPAAW